MIRLTLNGEPRSLDVAPETPLLWVLRDHLKLRGAKFGCGKGLCGCCTVLLGGCAVRSCVTPVGAAEGREITTIEGLSRDGDHPLQRAWREGNVPQCGYCQSGQLMSAAGLLSANPRPSRDEIREGMSGNICRCGTYGRIERAILKASGQA